MTKSLILDSLEIRQFRAFRHLRIESLGRVNLIVGKNNVGKTCLIETLLLYASRGSLSVMQELLEARDETSLFPAHRAGDAKDQSVRFLFHGRKALEEQPEPIQIGPVDSPNDTLSIAVARFTEGFDETGRQQWRLLSLADYDSAEVLIPGLTIKMGAQLILHYPLAQDIRTLGQVVQPKKFKDIPYAHVPPNGLGKERLGLLWDGIALTDLEQDVLASLRIIAPEVERVTLVVNQESNDGRIPIVKVAKIDEPVPLRSLGEGMNRLFGIALALVNAQNGMLLIDEVESGLHYSAQPDLWRLVFEAARRLNVQVFATTHSWDCIAAFQEAALQDNRGEGLLISLREKKGEKGRVVAVVFDENELAIVTREQIEVR